MAKGQAHPNTHDTWPARPAGEIFPELLTTTDVAQLLRYDNRPGSSPAKACRMVRLRIRDDGLPTLGRVGRNLLFRKKDVLAWLESRNGRGGHAENNNKNASTGPDQSNDDGHADA